MIRRDFPFKYKFLILIINIFNVILSQYNEKNIDSINDKNILLNQDLHQQTINNTNQTLILSPKIDLKITLSPNEYQIINLDTLFASQGFQRDDYKFSNLELVDYKKNSKLLEEGNNKYESMNGDLAFEKEKRCLDEVNQQGNQYLSSFQIIKNFEKISELPIVPKFQKHVQIQQTKIHVFITDTKILFTEKQDKDYQTIEVKKFQFKSCLSHIYFSKDMSDSSQSSKFIVFDCDINLQKNIEQIFLIIDITKVNTLADINEDIISSSFQQKETICIQRNLISMVYTMKNPDKETTHKDIFIQSCMFTNTTDKIANLYVSEVTLHQGKLYLQPRVEINTSQQFPTNPLAMSVDVKLNNRLYFFFGSEPYPFIQLFELRYKGVRYYELESIMLKKVYGKQFSTAKFLQIFKQNPLEKRNYLICTPQESYNNLYVLDVTKETNMAYVSKKILLPSHIIEQTLITRDFVIIKGCINQTKQTIYKCQDVPIDKDYQQFIAVFSSKENRYNVHYYEKYQTSSKIFIEAVTDNYILNNILIINSETGNASIYQIRDNYLKIVSSNFNQASTQILQFSINSTDLIQKMDFETTQRKILINFAQSMWSLKLTEDGNKLFQNKAIQKDDLYFTVNLNKKIMGPQIEYLLIKEFHDSQKYNVTINNFLRFDLTLDIPAKYKDKPYNVTLTHVTNANFNQIQIFTQFNTSMYVGLISKENPFNQKNQILVAFYMKDKKYQAQEIAIDQISQIEVIDQQYIGIVRVNAKQILILELEINQTSKDGENEEVIVESQLFDNISASLDIDFEFTDIVKCSMKLFTTRSIIVIHTSDNIIRVQGIFWKKGYSNSQYRFGMNTVYQLQLNPKDKCHFTVFNYPIVIIVCINEQGESSIDEYTLSQDKTLIKKRSYNLFQYKINLDLLKLSFFDKIFFYQKAYYINTDQRTQIDTLLVFDPLEMSTNTLKSASNIQSQYFNIPFDIDSNYGSYMLYNSESTKTRNQVSIISINNNPSLSFNVAPLSTKVDFNFTFYALSNYTQSSIFRKMQISTNMEQYMVAGNSVDKGWSRIDDKKRFISLSIPQDIFKGPIRRMFLLNTTDLSLIDSQYSVQNQENAYNDQVSGLQRSEMVLRNRYYITLSQMMIPTKRQEETNYVNIQKNFGQIIDAAYLEQDDMFIFLMQKKIIFMPAKDKNIKTHLLDNEIFANRPLNFDYSQCSLYHHLNWRLFFVLCRGIDSNELHRIIYTYDVTNIEEKKPKIQEIIKIKTESQDYGIIQTMVLSENKNQELNIANLTVFILTRVDKNYDESVIKVQSFVVPDTLFDLFIIDANSLDRRSLYAIDISVKSFTAEIDSNEMFMIQLLTNNEIFFVIWSQSGMIYRASIKDDNSDGSLYEYIDLQRVSYFRLDVPCVKISYVIQYEKKDAYYQTVNMCSPQKQSETKAIQSTSDWYVEHKPITIEIYKHYKTCQQYSAKPISYWGKEQNLNDTLSNEQTPLYLARFCVFNTNQVHSSIEKETSSKNFHLILYTNKDGSVQQTQTVIELPFFNNKPSTILFYQQETSDQSIHILVTSYINLYIDYLIQNSYYINLYFKYPQEYLLSKKRILIQGENDHFSNYAIFDYNVIDYTINNQSKYVYAKLIVFLISTIIYMIPVMYLLIDKKKLKKEKKQQQKQQQQKDDISPRFNLGRMRDQSVFGEDMRQYNNSPENIRNTYDNQLSTPSQYVINSNMDHDSDNDQY